MFTSTAHHLLHASTTSLFHGTGWHALAAVHQIIVTRSYRVDSQSKLGFYFCCLDIFNFAFWFSYIILSKYTKVIKSFCSINHHQLLATQRCAILISPLWIKKIFNKFIRREYYWVYEFTQEIWKKLVTSNLATIHHQGLSG